MNTRSFRNAVLPPAIGISIALIVSITLIMTQVISGWNETGDRLAETRSMLAQTQSRSDSLETVVMDMRQTDPAERHRQAEWLARMLISETNRPEEMVYVAWVARNRLDMNYRGATSYRDVVLQPRQFSAFNRGMRYRAYYRRVVFDGYHQNSNTPRHSTEQARRQALSIAYQVMGASRSDAPFGSNVTHFYSPVSMSGGVGHMPPWAPSMKPVTVESVDSYRFRFFQS